MRKIFYQICAAFIRNKEKRKAFRQKYIVPLRKRSIQLTTLSQQNIDIWWLKDEIIRGVQRSITTALLHQKTFSEFRNKFNDKEVVLVGAGPTLKQFIPIKNAIYVGLNRCFLYDKVHFDYLFTADKAGLDLPDNKLYKQFFSYDAIKFVGDQNLGIHYQIPYSEYADAKNVRCYKTTAGYLGDKLAYDIDSEPLANSCSVSVQAMQFIMFTNPKKIYLVGIDCTGGSKGHFSGESFDAKKRNEDFVNNDKNAVLMWKHIKEFAQTYYPKTEIISINPVGLKGIFTDLYQSKEE